MVDGQHKLLEHMYCANVTIKAGAIIEAKIS